MINKRKTVKIIIITLFLFFLIYFVFYYIMIKSDAYKTCTEFIKNNNIIISNFGKVKEYYLSPTEYSIRTSGTNGHANLCILFYGEKKNGKICLELEKKLGVWKIVNKNIIDRN